MSRLKKKISLQTSTEQNKNDNAPVSVNLDGESKKPLEDLKTDFLNEQEERIKKPRGRAAQNIKEAEAKEEFKKSISGIGGMVIGLVVKRLPNPVPLDEFEKEQFNLAFDNIAVKYIGYIDNYKEEVALLFASVLIIAPRLKKPTEKKTDSQTE